MKTSSLLIAALTILLVVTVGASVPPSQDTPPPSGEGLPDGAGKDLMVRTCGVCHEPRRAASVRLTREGWTSVVEDMVRRGAKGTEDEMLQITEYLVANFLGDAPRPVNVYQTRIEGDALQVDV